MEILMPNDVLSADLFPAGIGSDRSEMTGGLSSWGPEGADRRVAFSGSCCIWHLVTAQ